MDWQKVKSAICEGRRFTVSDQQCHVLSDVIMPSGGSVRIYIQHRSGSYFLNDGGAAFDELSRHGAELPSPQGVRRMLSDASLRLDDDGLIWCERVDLDQIPTAIAVVADASLRAASYMLARSRVGGAERLDRRVKAALRQTFPDGQADFTIQGKSLQHRFDFALKVGGSRLLIEAVTPDPSSVGTAIAKGLDVKQADSNVVPLFVFDPEDHWGSGNLDMLQLGGKGVDINNISQIDRIAA